jgi:hypothetical protein
VASWSDSHRFNSSRPSLVALSVHAGHQKYWNKYKCRSYQRKICDFRYNVSKHIVSYHDWLLKTFHLVLASDMSARALQDEVVHVRR